MRQMDRVQSERSQNNCKPAKSVQSKHGPGTLALRSFSAAAVPKSVAKAAGAATAASRASAMRPPGRSSSRAGRLKLLSFVPFACRVAVACSPSSGAHASLEAGSPVAVSCFHSALTNDLHAPAVPPPFTAGCRWCSHAGIKSRV